MRHEEYCGFTNWETWNAYNWLTNDENLYKCWVDVARGIFQSTNDANKSRHMIAKQLQEQMEEDNPLDGNSMYVDFLNAALAEVNHFEIADALLSEVAGYEGVKA